MKMNGSFVEASISTPVTEKVAKRKGGYINEISGKLIATVTAIDRTIHFIEVVMIGTVVLCIPLQ